MGRRGVYSAEALLTLNKSDIGRARRRELQLPHAVDGALAAARFVPSR